MASNPPRSNVGTPQNQIHFRSQNSWPGDRDHSHEFKFANAPVKGRAYHETKDEDQNWYTKIPCRHHELGRGYSMTAITQYFLTAKCPRPDTSTLLPRIAEKQYGKLRGDDIDSNRNRLYGSQQTKPLTYKSPVSWRSGLNPSTMCRPKSTKRPLLHIRNLEFISRPQYAQLTTRLDRSWGRKWRQYRPKRRTIRPHPKSNCWTQSRQGVSRIPLLRINKHTRSPYLEVSSLLSTQHDPTNATRDSFTFSQYYLAHFHAIYHIWFVPS